MRKIFVISIAAFALLIHISVAEGAGAETVTFQSADGVQITADLYLAHGKEKPFIVLFHQAGWSRGEYIEIAPRLNRLGFNCMAVDLRSGNGVNGIKNRTVLAAVAAKKKTRYVDTVPDMEAALQYVRGNYAKGKLIAWGSSYSAALVFKVAASNPTLIDGLLSFSPGEYFAQQGKSPRWIRDAARNITVPTFITSAKKEKGSWSAIYDALGSDKKTSYLPRSRGNHGSRALWNRFEDSISYWEAVENFLKSNFLD